MDGERGRSLDGERGRSLDGKSAVEAQRRGRSCRPCTNCRGPKLPKKRRPFESFFLYSKSPLLRSLTLRLNPSSDESVDDGVVVDNGEELERGVEEGVARDAAVGRGGNRQRKKDTPSSTAVFLLSRKARGLQCSKKTLFFFTQNCRGSEAATESGCSAAAEKSIGGQRLMLKCMSSS